MVALATACTGDGHLLYVQVAASQPDDPMYGRLLSVFASRAEQKASRLHLTAVGGELRDVATSQPVPDVCVLVGEDRLVEQQVAVLPTTDEAVLVAVLREAGSDCSGSPLTQIMVPIQRAGAAAGEVTP